MTVIKIQLQLRQGGQKVCKGKTTRKTDGEKGKLNG